MALIYQATLTPSKLETLQTWVPSQAWSGAPDAASLEVMGAFRFDDPAGEVGIETHLLRAGPTMLQVPVTYRGAPLPGADADLIGIVEHSVLGRRWVYDACADPVYAQTLAAAVLTGGTEATLDYAVEGGPVQQRSTGTRVQGSGVQGASVPSITEVSRDEQHAATVVRGGGIELVVYRVIGRVIAGGAGPTAPSLIGTWPGQDFPLTLVNLR